jgi:hypothetical protein
MASSMEIVIAQPRFKAQFHGQVLGWFDTAEAAQASIDAAFIAEQNEIDDYNRWYDERENAR